MATIFEQIINGNIPCHKVWEDEHHLAFLDVNPRTIGHTLVIPKKVSEYLFDMSSPEYLSLWEAAQKVAILLKHKLNCKRVCVGVWGFEVAHTHVHLFPMNEMKDAPIAPVDANAVKKLSETAKLLTMTTIIPT